MRIVKSMVLPMLLAVSFGVQAADMDYSRARKLALALEENASAEYMQQMLRFYESAAYEFAKKCVIEQGMDGDSIFSVVSAIDVQGSILNVWTSGDDGRPDCFSSVITGMKFPIPPKAPYYSVVDMQP